MVILSELINYIKEQTTQNLNKYIAIYLGSILLILLTIIVFYYMQVNKNIDILKKTQTKALETKEIINKFEKVQEEQKTVQEILDQDKTFRIVPVYEEVIRKLGLSRNSSPEIKSFVNKNLSIKDKIERVLKAQLTNINTKNLIDLLSSIASIKQIYPKELIIKKSPQGQNIDIEITLATLETEVIS